MFTWLAANAATIIIGGILLAAVTAALRSVWKKRKSGHCAGCGGCCGKCSGKAASAGNSPAEIGRKS